MAELIAVASRAMAINNGARSGMQDHSEARSNVWGHSAAESGM